ncbi:MAG: hypothetical protein P8Y47_02330 [Alphaproteobacteria bacterium]
MMARKIKLPSKYDGRTTAAKRLAATSKALAHEFRVAHQRSPTPSEQLSLNHLASLDTHRHEIEREVDAGTRPRTSATTQQIISIADAIRREREGIGLTAPAHKAPLAIAYSNASANANANANAVSSSTAPLPTEPCTINLNDDFVRSRLTFHEMLFLSQFLLPAPRLTQADYDRRLTPDQFHLEWKDHDPYADKVLESCDLDDMQELCLRMAAEMHISYEPLLRIPTTRPGMDPRVWMQAQMLTALVSDREDPAEVELFYDALMQDASARRARIRRAERKAKRIQRERLKSPEASEKLFDDIRVKHAKDLRLDTTLPDVAEAVQGEYAEAKAEALGSLVRARLSEEDRERLYELHREIVTGVTRIKFRPWQDPDGLAYARSVRTATDHDIDYGLMYQRRR